MLIEENTRVKVDLVSLVSIPIFGGLVEGLHVRWNINSLFLRLKTGKSEKPPLEARRHGTERPEE